MQKEIERITAKRNNTALGSPEYLAYTDILLELSGVRLHKEEDALCDGCA